MVRWAKAAVKLVRHTRLLTLVSISVIFIFCGNFAFAESPPGIERAFADLAQWIRSGKFSDVLDHSQPLLDAARAAHDPDAEMRLMALRATALSNLGRHREAADEALAMAARLEQLGAEAARVQALGAAALSLLDAETPERVAGLLQDAVRAGENEARQPAEAAESLALIARELAARHREDLALKLGEAAVTIARRSVPDSLPLAEDLALLGYIEGGTARPAATAHLAEALAIRDKLDPQSVTTALVLYDLAQDEVAAGDVATALPHYRRAADIVAKAGVEPDLLGRILQQLGSAALDLGDLAAARDSIPRAVALLRATEPGSRRLGEVLANSGVLHMKQDEFEAATRDLREAATVLGQADPTSNNLASIYYNLASVALHGRDFAQARDDGERALAIARHNAPDGAITLGILALLGDIARQAGDPARELDDRQQRTAILARQQPGSEALVDSLLALAEALRRNGDEAAADDRTAAAIAILRGLGADTWRLAVLQARLGALQHDRGAFAAARLHLQEALRIAERLAPTSPEVRQILSALADTIRQSGDLEAARRLVGRLQDLQQAAGAPTAETIDGINLLCSITSDEGNHALAQEYCDRALDIEGSDPALASQRAETLNTLGLIALASTSVINPQQGDGADLDIAERRFREASEITNRLDPGSANAMQMSMNLAVVLGRRQRLAESEAVLRRLLPQAENLPANRWALAKILLNLGSFIAVDSKRRDEALDYFRRAVEAQETVGPDTLDMARMLDAQAFLSKDRRERERLRLRAYAIARAYAATLVDDDARQHFASILAFYATELLRAQIALDRWGDAFVTSEESRAFALQQLLAGRARRAPAPQEPAEADAADPTEREARLRAAEERLELRRFQSAAPAAIAEAEAAVASARAAYLDSRQSEVRPTDDRSDGRERPKLDQAEVGLILDPDTVYLSFSWDQRGMIWFLVYRDADGTVLADPGGIVTDDEDGVFIMASTMHSRSQFFMMQGGRSRFAPTGSFATGPDFVAVALDEFRRAVTDYRSETDTVTKAGRSAFTLMFPQDARKIILGAKHLLIAPDGPLWSIPFAALVVNDSGPPDYLGDHVAISYTQSLVSGRDHFESFESLTGGAALG